MAGLIILSVVLVAAYVIPLIFSPSSPQVMDNLSISAGSSEFSILTLVAKENGYFASHGLNVTFTAYPSGIEAMDLLLAKKVDLAYAAEFVGVTYLLRPSDIRILGTTATSEVISLVTRNDRNITSTSDLKGKIIAVPKNTQAEFFLGRFLTLSGMNYTDVKVRYLAPAEIVTSVVQGESDGAVIWEPYASRISQGLGDNGRSRSAQNGQMFFWTIYTRPDVLHDKSAILTRYFKALSDAEKFIINHKPEAQSSMTSRLNLSDEYADQIWQKMRFATSLDQSLIIAMEDETRWMMSNNLTKATLMPVYPVNLSPEFLKKEKPWAVNIIGEER